MNIVVKTAVAGALSLGATGAFALGIPALNSSDLVLVVENTTTSATYELDTGITLGSLLPAGQYVTNASLSTAIAGLNSTLAASPTLQSFLAANPAAGDGWVLEGGQYNGGSPTTTSTNGNSKAAGAALAVYTTVQGTGNTSAITGQTLTNLEAFENGINGDVVNTTGGLYPLQTAAESTAGSISANAIAKYGTLAADVLEALGNTDTLYGLTGNGNTGVLQSYILGKASLAANGTLTLTGNSTTPPVPLPAAVWLFGSGLMGLVGISRRRKAAV